MESFCTRDSNRVIEKLRSTRLQVSGPHCDNTVNFCALHIFRKRVGPNTSK